MVKTSSAATSQTPPQLAISIHKGKNYIPAPMKLKLTLLSLSFFSAVFSFAQTKLADLNVDTSITGFHFAADFQGTRVFTKNGPSDLRTINPTAFSFTLARNMRFEMAKDQLEQLLNMSKENGYKIDNLVGKDTLLKGNKAYYISYIETDDKAHYKNDVFNAFVIKNETVILFTGGDLDNGKYTERFKKTFYGIKL